MTRIPEVGEKLILPSGECCICTTETGQGFVALAGEQWVVVTRVYEAEGSWGVPMISACTEEGLLFYGVLSQLEEPTPLEELADVGRETL